MKEKKKTDFVYVLDSDGKPLMPTRRFGKVRRMVIQSSRISTARR